MAAAASVPLAGVTNVPPVMARWRVVLAAAAATARYPSARSSDAQHDDDGPSLARSLARSNANDGRSRKINAHHSLLSDFLRTRLVHWHGL